MEFVERDAQGVVGIVEVFEPVAERGQALRLDEGVDVRQPGLLDQVEQSQSRPVDFLREIQLISSFCPGNSLTKAKLPRMVAGVCFRIRILPTGKPNIHSESKNGANVFWS